MFQPVMRCMEFLLWLEALNIQKQTDCIILILIHFLYIFSILSLQIIEGRIRWETFTYTVLPRVRNTDLYGGECLTLSMACTNTLRKVHLSSNQGIENC